MNSILRFSNSFHRLLHQPKKILWICTAFIFLSLGLNGSLLRLYGLSRDQENLAGQLIELEHKISELNQQLKIVQDPKFIERQARDRYDLVDENDLVFVFSED